MAQLWNDKKYQRGISQASGTWRMCQLPWQEASEDLDRICLQGNIHLRSDDPAWPSCPAAWPWHLDKPGSHAARLGVRWLDAGGWKWQDRKTSDPCGGARMQRLKSWPWFIWELYWLTLMFWLLLSNGFPIDPGYRFFSIQEPFISKVIIAIINRYACFSILFKADVYTHQSLAYSCNYPIR